VHKCSSAQADDPSDGGVLSSIYVPMTGESLLYLFVVFAMCTSAQVLKLTIPATAVHLAPSVCLVPSV